MKNNKIQRWAVLLAEYGCEIKYHEGVKNIRADMLSRIKPNTPEIGRFDMEENIDPNVLLMMMQICVHRYGLDVE